MPPKRVDSLKDTNTMSNETNDVWLLQASEHFEEAALAGNFEFARAVIEDLKARGFEGAAHTLEMELITLQSNDDRII